VVFEPRGRGHFDSHHDQDNAQRYFQIPELVHHSRQGEIETSQAQDGKDVAREN
jgi:hypothetical protein